MTTLHARSFFSGIGGFEIGAAATGEIETIDLVEFDEHCQTLLSQHYSGINLNGDISDVVIGDLSSRATGPEVWWAGFPCQNTSIGAPHRLGLAGSKSHHFFDFIRLVHEWQRLLAQRRPEWVVLENPPGLLKSNSGRDMATVVRCLEELGYGWAYRVVDGRHFELPGGGWSPQRRERILVVGHHSGDPLIAGSVLGLVVRRGEADPTNRVRRPGRQALGSAPVGGAAFDAVWRKSARPRAALSAGGYETWVSDGLANTLTGFDWGKPTRQVHLIAQDGRLRAPTITEWERLNGFPDGHTSGVPESARALMIGNSAHTGMTHWIAEQIVDEQLTLEAA